MKKLSQTCEKGTLEKKNHKFLVFFLKNDKDRSIHVEEVEKIDFSEISRHLNFGESIFIAHRKKLGDET